MRLLIVTPTGAGVDLFERFTKNTALDAIGSPSLERRRTAPSPKAGAPARAVGRDRRVVVRHPEPARRVALAVRKPGQEDRAAGAVEAPLQPGRVVAGRGRRRRRASRGPPARARRSHRASAGPFVPPPRLFCVAVRLMRKRCPRIAWTAVGAHGVSGQRERALRRPAGRPRGRCRHARLRRTSLRLMRSQSRRPAHR